MKGYHGNTTASFTHTHTHTHTQIFMSLCSIEGTTAQIMNVFNEDL